MSDGGEEHDSGDDDSEDPVDAFVDEVTDHPDPDADDPFERLDAGPGREGDPFDRLEGGPDDGSPRSAGSPGGADPTAAGGDAGSTGPGTEPHVPDDGPSDATGGSHDPFDGFEDAGGDPFEGSTGVFQQVDAGEAEGVWERIDEEDATEVEEVPGQRYVEVSKHSYCERCEYFSPPPEVACNHEGTEILEFTDMETVRVVNCPIVEERRALEDEG